MPTGQEIKNLNGQITDLQKEISEIGRVALPGKTLTYTNSRGFSFDYPAYFLSQENSNNIFKAKSDKYDGLEMEVVEQSMDGIEYLNPSGGFALVYSEEEKKWLN